VNQPRAVGALFALEEGLNVVISRPGLFGFVPCLVLGVRACIGAGALIIASAVGIDQLFWELNGVALFEVSQDTWALAAMGGGGLLIVEHLAVHLVITTIPLTLRGQKWTLREVLRTKSLLTTAVLRMLGYVAVVTGFLLFGFGVILALPLVFAPYYAADQGLGAFGSCARGARLVVNHFGTIVFFEFISLGLLLCGFLVCGIGFVPAYLVTTAGRAALYDQLATTEGSRPPSAAHQVA
jgi:uncharacterized membrane protein